MCEETEKSIIEFNDLNDDCMEKIFNFLTFKDKVEFAKVCQRWSSLYNQLMKISSLQVYVLMNECDKEREKIKLSDLFDALAICGSSLKYLEILFSSRADVCTLRINNEYYTLDGTLKIDSFVEHLANMCKKIKKFRSSIDLFYFTRSCTWNTFIETFDKLILENKEMEEFECLPPNLVPDEIFRNHIASLKKTRHHFFEDNQEELCQFLSGSQNLVSLELDFYYHPSISAQEMQRIFSNLKYIRALSFINHHVNNMDAVLYDLSTSCKNLETLRLQNCKFSSRGLLNAILDKSKLVDLHIDFLCDFLPDEHTSPLTNLQCFKGNGFRYHVSEDTMKTFFRFKNLKEIHLISQTNFTDDMINTMCASCKMLEHVEMAGLGKVTNGGIFSLLSSSPNLTTLTLAGLTYVSDLAPDVIHHSKSNLKNLSFLDFEISRVTLRQFNAFPNLRKLELQWKILNKPRLQDLRIVLMKCQKLEEIIFRVPDKADVEIVDKRFEELLDNKFSLKRFKIIDGPITEPLVKQCERKIIVYELISDKVTRKIRYHYPFRH